MTATAAIPRSLLAGMLVAFAVLAFRIVSVESPTMASDEYAVIAQGRYADAAQKLALADPGLQPVRNAAYPPLYAAWRALAPDQAGQVGRLFNALLFVSGALLLFAAFRRVFDESAASIGALLYLALPMSFYATTLLPEVEFQWSVYLVSLVVVFAGIRPRASMVALAAILCALSYQVKPHAAALIAGCAAYWVAASLLDRERRLSRRWLRGLALAGLHLALAGSLIVLGNSLSGPSAAGGGLVPGFYQGYLANAISGTGAVSRLGSLADYAGGHAWVLAALFSPGLFAIAAAIRTAIRPPVEPVPDSMEQRRNFFALYVALLLGAFLAMVALFTASAAELSPGEQFRLHGRYLAGVLPFLLGFSVWACGRRPSWRAVALAVLCLASFAVLGRKMYKLFPWDYPEAFGFFLPPVPYWSFDGQLAWPFWLTVLAAFAAAAACLRARSARVPFVMFSLAWMASAQVQMWRWVDQQADSTRPWVAAADAIEAYLGPVPALSGAVLTEDRYGLTSAFLASLDRLQHVVIVPDGKRMRRGDLPRDVGWVVVPPGVDVAFEGAAQLDFGGQRLFLLDGRHAWPGLADTPTWDGKPIVMRPATDGEPHRFHGFNAPEAWGSWSREPRAHVELPARVSGRVRVSVFAWLLPSHPDHRVRVGFGEPVTALTLGDAGAMYHVDLDAGAGHDRLTFETSVLQPPGEARALGLALGSVRIDALREEGPTAKATP